MTNHDAVVAIAVTGRLGQAPGPTPNEKSRPKAAMNLSRIPDHHSRSLTRRRAIDWLCSWHTRLSVTLRTAAISLRFMSCS